MAALRITRSSENVFADLGFDEDEAELFSIDTLIDMLARGGTHVDAVLSEAPQRGAA